MSPDPPSYDPDDLADGKAKLCRVTRATIGKELAALYEVPQDSGGKDSDSGTARPLGEAIAKCRFWPAASLSEAQRFGRFSNRPVWVKHFQAIHLFSVNVAHGLVLLFGIGTKALPSWAVSYTHLDVYKRQSMGCLKQSRNIGPLHESVSGYGAPETRCNLLEC